MGILESTAGKLQTKQTAIILSTLKGKEMRGFPGGPVVKTPRFHCRGRGFDPLSVRPKKRVRK